MNPGIRSVLLDCEHTIYFRKEYSPSPGEPVYCIRCGTDRQVPSHDRVKGTYYPEGDWYCYKKTEKTSRGRCRPCGYEYEGTFRAVRTRMENHHRKGCDNQTLDVKVVLLPPNSPPPF